jgi:predicted N-formylglutamate amidohydrolase
MTASDAAEILPGQPDARWVLTCEHASEELPPGWSWPDADRRLLGTHWAVDLGIAQLTRTLAERLGAPAVLARFSRLLIDPNRHLSAGTLFRRHCDGAEVELNQNLSFDERQRRIQACYEPFHATIDAMVGGHPAAQVLSMHSFTPVYEGGEPRWMEIGVLFDHDEALAHAVAARLASTGLRVAINEPYTGQGGLMHSASTHALRHGRRAVELEVRQDLATDPTQQERLVQAIASAVSDPSLPTGPATR